MPTNSPARPDSPSRPDLEGLKVLLGKATPGKLIADTHHTKDYAGRTHGFLRAAGELVPVAGFMLGVDGMPDDVGRARLALCAEAVNALPSLIAHVERLEKALKPFADEAATWADDVPDDHRSLCTEPSKKYAHPGSETTFTVGDLRLARATLSQGTSHE
jgi:hypothetical protein